MSTLFSSEWLVAQILLKETIYCQKNLDTIYSTKEMQGRMWLFQNTISPSELENICIIDALLTFKLNHFHDTYD